MQESCCAENFIFKNSLSSLIKFNEAFSKNQSIPFQDFKSAFHFPKPEIRGNKLFDKINEASQVNTSILWSCFSRQFQWEFILTYLFKQIELLMKIGFSYFISQTFYSLEQNQKQKCYLFTALVGLFWLVQIIFYQISWNQMEKTSLKIKGTLAYAIYLKILSTSKLSIQRNEIGQIINSVTQFHDILQNEATYIFNLLAAPLAIIGLTALLVNQIGWISIVGVALYLLFQFLHYHYARFNAGIYSVVSKFKDQRISILTEAISAFRYIKMQVWENLFISKISSIRKSEMNSLIKYGAGRSIETSLNQGVSTAIALLTFGLILNVEGSITTKSIISSVINFYLITILVVYSSYGIGCYYKINSLMGRLASIFSKKNKKVTEAINAQKQHQQRQIISEDNRQNNIIILQRMCCSYGENVDQQSVFIQTGLLIKRGEFIGVFGKVGEGKSTFLNVLAKQMLYTKGKIQIFEDAAFQQSEPALFSGSIQDNILFGKKMNRALYEKAINYSCLDSDLKLFQLGDKTIIQEGAVNLSGGQRTRICLARVIYADKPILLLDDPLSSLDLKVIQKIMFNLIKLNKAERKTIILVTHQIHCLLKCDRCIQVSNKRLNSLNTEQFFKVKEEYWDINLDEQKYYLDYDKENNEVINEIMSIFLINNIEPAIEEIKYKEEQKIFMKNNNNEMLKNGFLVELFTFAFKNKCNYFLFPLTLILYAINAVLQTLVVFFLNQFDSVQNNTNNNFETKDQFWIILGIMSSFIFIIHIVKKFLLNLNIQLSNKSLHKLILRHIFKCNVLELDKLGTKGILNKFSTDLGMLDFGILEDLTLQITFICVIIVQVIVIAIYNPIILPFVFAIIVPNYIWYQYCIKMISSLKQMDLQMKGPVIALFSQTLNGLIQIHNMKAQNYMLSRLKDVLNNSITFSVNFRKIFRVYSAYLNYYTTLLIIGGYFAIIAMNDSRTYDHFTFAAVFLVELNDWIIWVFSIATRIKSTLISAQRLISLAKLKTDVQFQQKTKAQNIESQVKIVANQSDQYLDNKQQYSINLHNISLKYEQNQHFALSKISITIEAGKKIALIGRTGSGKSSIIQVLYRLVDMEPNSAYFIEGQNALTMDIQSLRQKFTCIPQIPFIFSDTLRSNIDPFGKFKDEQIKEALKKACIYENIERYENGINTSLSKINLSAGQKQLICLARALLQNKRFLILDEATANIDHKTDEIIQAVLRKEFVGKTIISVAHRLQNILDFDKIIVLSQGKIVQTGTAYELWLNKGEFRSIIQESGFQKYKLVDYLQRNRE